MTQASFSLQGHNPDVLTCIANLSNDEVFTPPEFANQMLDTMEQAWADSNDGESIWGNKNVTFLDPCTKSGVFLREIVKRLNVGLTGQIPDLTERINHILTKQVFGIGITELTSLIARRSVYCSKYANGIHSVARTFANDDGNIWFNRTEHTWANGKCEFCGASKAEYARSKELETHAYAFIHTNDSKSRLSKMFGESMHFDVIIGNPPYQLSDGGGTGSSAVPIYQHFVDQARRLDPAFLAMVIPARWMVGGRGLEQFRNEMLNDRRIRVLHDYPDASDVFRGVEIKGGVCYFLWGRDHEGDCEIHTHYGAREVVSTRPLLEDGIQTFLRHSELVDLLRKIQNYARDNNFSFFDEILHANDTFGFDVRQEGSYRRVQSEYKLKPFENAIELYYNGWRQNGIGYVSRKKIRKGHELIDVPKVLIPKAWGVGDPKSDRLSAFAVGSGTCSTETYIVAGGFKNLREAKNAVQYTQTKFFHFLVSFMKPTQNASKRVYRFVPKVEFDRKWNDRDLYELFNLSESEINQIESLIWPDGVESE
jgi:site-specific DNA-methyltransferase (adenine-specific)